ncbi:Armadillo/beta-catenin/plakoglobin [Mycena sanguinolenta]|uniref:uridine/cytidine kinase n=1 Tax=Mycena sanguinolenta TaxID=230812 RepID=A0A8H6ZDE9_9AGAR|nr:Armadillo/beta-catenin/plakoglobin [Mycena sanguinolenta]
MNRALATRSPLPKLDTHHQPVKNTVLVSHGRPPWYGENGERISDAFVVGIAGGSGSGKTHVAQQIVRNLGHLPSVVILSQDSFYKRHTDEELALAFTSSYDFDHPDSIDMPLFAACLADLKACRQSNIPVYSFVTHQREDEPKYLYGAAIILAEGIMALQDPGLREVYDLKLFVQCDSDLMLARRIKRDVEERGRSVNGILEQYLRYVKPAYDNYVLPSQRYADIIVPGHNNTVAIDLICTHIKKKLQERSNAFRRKMALPHLYASPSGRSLPECKVEDLNLTILPQTRQLEGIFTILRSKTSSRQDFIFFVDRLATLLMEFALQFLPYSSRTVTTPTQAPFTGKYVCGVSILRSGGTLERGFKRVFNDVPMGSLLVPSNDTDGEPLMLHVMLPVCIRKRPMAEEAWVFLLDAQIGTGASAFMAIRILLDHGVKPQHIIFVTFLVARGGGISVLRRAFPDIHIVTAGVDDVMLEGWVDGSEGNGNPQGHGRQIWSILPGLGQIGELSDLVFCLLDVLKSLQPIDIICS